MIFTRGRSVEIPELARAEDLPSEEFLVLETVAEATGVRVKVQNLRSAAALYTLRPLAEPAAGDSEHPGGIEEEVATWRRLSCCSGVVPALCAAVVNGRRVVCTPWMEGGNLRRVMHRRDPAAFFGTAIRGLRTLEWAHRTAGAVHSGLHPENILFDMTDLAHLSDWGIAAEMVRQAVPAGPSRVANEQTAPDDRGDAVDILRYVSPEVIRGEPADFRSDLYSLGCILFEWETGKPPFAGTTPEAMAYQHLHRTPPRLGGLRRRSTFGANEAISRCLRKQPAQRFSSHAELLEILLDRARRKGIDPSASGLTIGDTTDTDR